jgi:hypothetical protein
MDRFPRVVDPKLVVLEVEDYFERSVLQDALLDVWGRISLEYQKLSMKRSSGGAGVYDRKSKRPSRTESPIVAKLVAAERIELFTHGMAKPRRHLGQ